MRDETITTKPPIETFIVGAMWGAKFFFYLTGIAAFLHYIE